MPSFAEVARAIYGAWRFAHLDREAIQWFDRSVDGAFRSFWAAALAVPVDLILLLLRVDGADWERSGVGRILIVEGIGYVIDWTAFPLAVFGLCRVIGRETRFLDFLVAYNWSQILQRAWWLAVAAVLATEVLPEAAGQVLTLLAIILVLAYEWYIARVTLDAGGRAATAVVLIDLVLSVALGRITTALY